MPPLLSTLTSLLLLLPSALTYDTTPAQTFTPGTFTLPAPGPFCSFGPTGPTLQLDADGNILIYAASPPTTYNFRWSSERNATNCNGQGCALFFQDDGNLVTYAGTTPLFWSGTTAKGALMVCAERQPYLMVFDAKGNLLWYPDVFPHTGFWQLKDCGRAPWDCVIAGRG